MKREISKITQKVKTKPGTLEHIGEEKKEDVKIYLSEYTQDTYTSKTINKVEDINFKKDDNVKWINIVGLKDIGIIKDLGEKFNLHPLLLEDVLNTGHQPKIEHYDNCIFVLSKVLKYDDEQNKIITEQISFILLKEVLITFQELEDNIFDNVIERIKSGSSIKKYGGDYLFYSLFDAMVDNYFLVLEKIAGKMDSLEDQLIENPDKNTLQEIYGLKREMIYIRNSIWPLRNIISNLTKNEFVIINEITIYYLRDVYDHIVQMIDIIETYRDILTGMMDIYISSIGNKTNEVMKVLTIFSTIFIPLTFLAGIYGMNFSNIPEYGWKYGYLMFWLVSLGILIYMIRFFKKKGWI